MFFRPIAGANRVKECFDQGTVAGGVDPFFDSIYQIFDSHGAREEKGFTNES